MRILRTLFFTMIVERYISGLVSVRKQSPILKKQLKLIKILHIHTVILEYTGGIARKIKIKHFITLKKHFRNFLLGTGIISIMKHQMDIL
jgi:hypothetical protein